MCPLPKVTFGIITHVILLNQVDILMGQSHLLREIIAPNALDVSFTIIIIFSFTWRWKVISTEDLRVFIFTQCC